MTDYRSSLNVAGKAASSNVGAYDRAPESSEKAAIRGVFMKLDLSGVPGNVITDDILHIIDRKDGKAGKGIDSKTFTLKDTRMFMGNYRLEPPKAPMSICEFTRDVLGGTCKDGHTQATKDDIYTHLMSDRQAFNKFKEYFGSGL